MSETPKRRRGKPRASDRNAAHAMLSCAVYALNAALQLLPDQPEVSAAISLLAAAERKINVAEARP